MQVVVLPVSIADKLHGRISVRRSIWIAGLSGTDCVFKTGGIGALFD